MHTENDKKSMLSLLEAFMHKAVDGEKDAVKMVREPAYQRGEVFTKTRMTWLERGFVIATAVSILIAIAAGVQNGFDSPVPEPYVPVLMLLPFLFIFSVVIICTNLSDARKLPEYEINMFGEKGLYIGFICGNELTCTAYALEKFELVKATYSGEDVTLSIRNQYDKSFSFTFNSDDPAEMAVLAGIRGKLKIGSDEKHGTGAAEI